VAPLRAFVDFLRSFSGNSEQGGTRLSIDIGSSAVKVLEAEDSSGALIVSNVGYTTLPATAVQNNTVVEPERVAEGIVATLDRFNLRTRKVVTVVPAPAVIVKKVVLPIQSGQNIESAVMLEASHLIPESLDNVNLDFQVLDWVDDGSKAEVLLVGAKKDIINSYVSAVAGAGLEPVVVDVDHFALENMFELNYDAPTGKAVGLVNIGARYTSINILEGGRSTFTGDVPAGGTEFNDVLMRQLGVSFEEAELLKSGGRVKGNGPEEVEPLVTSVTEFLIEEIQRNLSFFWTAATEEPLGAIYLSGGAGVVPGFAAQLSQRLDVPVELVDPFRRIAVDARADRRLIQEHGSAFAVCVGLATRKPGDK
jgi:type IV pilus assembly protein PilM